MTAVLAQPKPRRIIDTPYRRWIKQQRCYADTAFFRRYFGATPLTCEGPIDAHHAIEEGQGKMGSKVDDRECVPACRWHHEYAERRPDLVREFFQELKARLWAEYRETHKSKIVRRVKREPSAKALIQHCPCGKSHPLSFGKIRFILDKGDIVAFQYRCPTSNKECEARTA